jgi:hypothetical protein
MDPRLGLRVIATVSQCPERKDSPDGAKRNPGCLSILNAALALAAAQPRPVFGAFLDSVSSIPNVSLTD